MRNLAMRLTGMSEAPSTLPAAAPVAPVARAGPSAHEAAPKPAAPEAPPPAEAAAPLSETPWIETNLCTTCDECILINKKIFAYDAEKRAIIKDPKGGPFRDIVKAAEKCSSGAIHPGQPLDPDEKDLDKWIKRAEPFQ
jgi:pyruvate-ferredoxin/flavodoxin oxidoreductase